MADGEESPFSPLLTSRAEKRGIPVRRHKAGGYRSPCPARSDQLPSPVFFSSSSLFDYSGTVKEADNNHNNREHPAPATPRTRGQIEAAITAAVSRFERDFLGRGPKDAQTFIVQDMILVRLLGILNLAERQLTNQPGGVELIKQLRSRLIENLQGTLKELIAAEAGLQVISMHTDISVRTGERMLVFVLDGNLEEMLRGAQHTD